MLLIKLQGSAKKFVPECLCAAAALSVCATERAHVCVCALDTVKTVH